MTYRSISRIGDCMIKDDGERCINYLSLPRPMTYQSISSIGLLFNEGTSQTLHYYFLLSRHMAYQSISSIGDSMIKEYRKR